MYGQADLLSGRDSTVVIFAFLDNFDNFVFDSPLQTNNVRLSCTVNQGFFTFDLMDCASALVLTFGVDWELNVRTESLPTQSEVWRAHSIGHLLAT